MTPKQLHILHHALGVNPRQRKPFRNYFLAGPTHYDMPDLEAREAAGMVKRGAPPKFCNQSDIVFRVTDDGVAYAMALLPEPEKRTRYEEYLHADTGYGFAEFLGINKPKYETRLKPGLPFRYEHRMYRLERGYYHFTDVAGEWKPTKKEAKASYKEALQRIKQAAQRGKEE